MSAPATDVLESPTARKFVLHWGEMGPRWGINRTVAMIHALLFITDRPLHAEEIAASLNVARSNVSTSLRELQNWDLIRVVHDLGDRRDHYVADLDVWEMFRIIVRERKRREADPTVTAMQECVESAKRDGDLDGDQQRRLKQLLEFFETISEFHDQIQRLPAPKLKKFARMGNRVNSLLAMFGN